jgi:hypothetical protein
LLAPLSGTPEPKESTMTQPGPPAPASAAPPLDKSVGAALVLTFFFGPLGLFYITTVGAVVMTIVAIIVAIITVGFGLLLIWPITMVWSAVVASRQHQEFETWKIGRLTSGSAGPI